MTEGQQMFRDFFMNLVQDGKEEEAEELLAEAFKHQDEGNLSAEYLEEVKQKYLALIKPEHMAEVKMIMSQYGI